jgi:hypothetical protein
MRVYLVATIIISAFFIVGLAHATGRQKGVCFKVSGEKIEIHNLQDKPIIIDREGIPDFVSTSMMESVSTAKGSQSYNIFLSGVKRDGNKKIISFEVKIDEKAYSYPNNSCGN